MFEAQDSQMFEFGAREQKGYFPLSTPVGLEKPVDQGIFRPQFEMLPEFVTVRTPKQFTGETPLYSAAKQPPE